MRILIVGGVPKRLHRGPVEWLGHRFEMVKHGFDRMTEFNFQSEDDNVTVDQEALSDFVDSTRGYDAVFCETPEALILSYERQKRGEPPISLLALPVHGLKRVGAMRKWYMKNESHDPWPEMLGLPWIAWIAASSTHEKVLLEAGVHAERIYRIDAGTSAYSMLLPNADALFDGGLDADGMAADGLPKDGVVAAGSGRRDRECYLKAAKSLPEIPFTVVDERIVGQRRRFAGTGLLELTNVRWLRAMALERYIALLRRARLVLVIVQPGSGDGGHTTVALAHRLGVAVICSKVPGIIDYVKDGYNARLVPPEDPESLAGAIQNLWNDSGERQRLINNGRKTELTRARVCHESVMEMLRSVSVIGST